jgi:RNA polymerase sigma-32 factor
MMADKKKANNTRTKGKPGSRTRSRADERTEVKTGSPSGSGSEAEAVLPDEIITAQKDLPDGESPHRTESSLMPARSSDKPAVYDPVSAYYQTIRHYPVLSREEEKLLALRYLENEDIDAAYRLVTSNLKLVIKIAMEYRRLWKEIVDLIQEGNMGLMQAVKKYDPYRGVRFSSYAAWWIRAYIIRYIMNNTRMVKLGTTQAQRTLYFQLGKERERLRSMGIEPDSKTLAKSLKVKESEVDEMTMRLSAGDLSLEATRGPDNDYSLLDTIPALQPDTESAVADAQVRTVYLEKLSEFIAGLGERDRKIFTMRWMRDDPYTLQEVGEKLGVTRERIRQLEARILKNLREYLEKEGLDASDFFS